MAATVAATVAAAMTMTEGSSSSDGEVEQWRLWQWTAALTADAAINGGGGIGCCPCRRTVIGATGKIIERAAGRGRMEVSLLRSLTTA